MLNQNFPLISAHWNILMDFMIQIMLVVHRQKLLANSRAATGDKAAKAWSFAGFWEIEYGGGSESLLMNWLPLWHPCLPKIYLGGPGYFAFFCQIVELFFLDNFVQIQDS